MNITLPKWAHYALTAIALAVPWALGTLFPALGLTVPALLTNLATLVVAAVNSINQESGK